MQRFLDKGMLNVYFTEQLRTLTRFYSPLTSFGLNARSRSGVACKLSSTSTAGANGKTLMLIRQQKRRRLSASHESALKERPDLLVQQRQLQKHQHRATGQMPPRTKRRNLDLFALFHIIPHNAISIKKWTLFSAWNHQKLFFT